MSGRRVATPDKAAFEQGAAQAAAALRQPAPGRGAASPPAAPRPLLLALGDSWFAYWPRGDVLDVLEERDRLDADSLAWAGAKLVEVLDGREFDPAQPRQRLAEGDPRRRPPQTTRLVDKLRALSAADRARLCGIAISAGGNDVADDDGTLGTLVADAGARKGPSYLVEAEAARIIDGEMRAHYARLLGFIDRSCVDVLGRSDLLILLHGYDWPVPDGRPALVKNWLAPVLEAKGYRTLDERRAVMKELIQRLNRMQAALIAALGRPNLHHIDLQGTLVSADHTQDWQNELHPTIPAGFGAIATRFLEVLNEAAGVAGPPRY